MAVAQDDPFGGIGLDQIDLSDPETRKYVSQYVDMNDPETKEYFNSFDVPATAGPSGATPEGPVSVSTPQAQPMPSPAQAPKAVPAVRNTETVVVNGFDRPEEAFLPKEVEARVLQMTNDPNVTPEQIGEYLTQQGRQVDDRFYEDLAKTRAAIEESGVAASEVDYQNAATLAAEIVPEEVKSMSPTEEGWLPAMVRSYQDGVQYGFPGIVARTYYDWMGTGEDVLRQRFPNLNDEEIEALQEAVIARTQKGLRETNTKLAENDPMVPWLAGQFFSSASPEDFIPAVRLAEGAKFAERLLTKMGEGTAVNAAGSAVYQAADIADGVQDEFSVTQLGADAGIGALFSGGIHATGELANAATTANRRRLAKAAGYSEEVIESAVGFESDGTPIAPPAPLPTPRGKKGSKVYKEDMDNLLDQTAEYVNAITADWTNAPQINVNRNFTKLKGIDNDARGVFNRETGEVDLNMEVITNEAARLELPVEDIIKSTVFHESLGHYGLLDQFGESLDNLLMDIVDNGEPRIKELVTKWMDENPDSYKGAPNRDILALEEVLAEWSEKGPRSATVYDRIANFIKQFARDYLGRAVNFSEREVKALLAQAHSKVIDSKGTGARGAGYRLKKLWHGSGATFDKFDHSYMGTGEGNQVFGWGTYLTESRGIGEGYQRAIGGEDILWGGVDMPWYQMRDAMDQEISGKYGNQMAVDVANAVFDHIRDSRRPPTPLTIAGAMGLKPRSEQQVKDVYDAMSPIIKDVENRIQRRVRGKLYEVEVADDLDWNLWNSDLSSQPKMKKALEEQGFKFVSEEEYRNNQKRFQDARSDYEDATAQYELAESDAASPVDNPTFKEELLDRLFTDVQVTAQKFQEAKRANENVVYDGLTGEDAYALLADKLGSDKAASLYLNEKGIAGNQYEAGTVAGTTPKNPDGSPVYNYVVFNDQTPKITARYSKPKKGGYLPVGEQAQNDNLTLDKRSNRTYEKTDRGRPRLPGRSMSHNEYAQFSEDTAEYYRNRAASFINQNERAYNRNLEHAKTWDARAQEAREKAVASGEGQREAKSVRPAVRETVVDTRATETPEPANLRYSQGKRFDDPRDVKRVPKPKRTGEVATGEPIDTSTFTPDELFEAENSVEVLKKLTDDHVPETMTMEDIEYEARLRGFTASDLMKRKEIGAGQLSQRLMMYDIAAGKLNDKLTKLYGKISEGGATPTDRAEYLKTVVRFQELGSRIFGEQSEVGRALRTIRDLNYTFRNVKGLEDMLGGKDVEGLEKLLAADPDMFLRFAREAQDQIDQSQKKVVKGGSRLGTFVGEVVNFPRAIMSSADLSAPLRQGIFLMHKPEWWRAMLSMFKYAASQESYNSLMRDITSRPSYKDMVKANVPFTKTDGRLAAREEDFMSSWAGKIPVLGSVVRGSERAYAGFLNKLRADVFDSMVENYQRAGIDFTADRDTLKALGGFIGNATGRGSLGESFNAATPWLSGLFFSPRLIASRVQMLNPYYYATLPKGVREQAVMSLLATGANATTVISLLSMSGLAPDVEADPRSSDFGKVKIGDTRYELLGGLSSYLTLSARLGAFSADTAAGGDLVAHYKNSMGEEKRYGNDFGESNALEMVGNFATNKSSPVASLVADFLRQEDFKGDAVTPQDAAISRMLPIIVQDIYEMGEKYGYMEGSARIAPAVFGAGVSDYKPYALDTERRMEAPDKIERSKLEDQATEDYTVVDGVVTFSPEIQALWQERLDEYLADGMESVTSDPAWEGLSDKEKAEIISDVRNEAKEEARKDALAYVGLE